MVLGTGLILHAQACAKTIYLLLQCRQPIIDNCFKFPRDFFHLFRAKFDPFDGRDSPVC
jgi:hypothetical protein